MNRLQKIAIGAAMHEIGWCPDTQAYEILQNDPNFDEFIDSVNAVCDEINADHYTVEDLMTFFDITEEELNEYAEQV